MDSPSSIEISSSDDKSAVKESPVPEISINSIYEPYQPIQVSLVDDTNLWSHFSKLGTEMIVNKIGRQIFPGIKLRFENMNPYKVYKVYMELAPVDGMRYRFDRNGWSPKGEIETSIKSSWIEHPQSPAEGFRWMMKPIDFNVRLTNSLENHNDDTIYLRSMFKYMIIIHVEEGNDATHRNPQLLRTFPLVNTSFIAVTTYQNHEVKDLKTATNIHAKGIRQKKLKKFQEMGHNLKENLGKRSISDSTDIWKRPRMEPDFSPTNLRRFFSMRDDSEVAKISQPTSVFPNLNNYFPRPMELNRNSSYTSPAISNYRGFETPVLNERIPVTAPLTVHCPSPYTPLEPSPYYSPLLLPVHHQNFPVFPPFRAPNFCPSSCPMYQNNCISPCRSTTLNICPSCRDGFQSCVSSATPLSLQMFNHATPSSTTDAEVSSSFENSNNFQTSARNSVASSVSDETSSNRSSVADISSSLVADALNHVYS